MNTRIPTFGFARWDQYPHRDESTVGFCGRMVEREGDDNFRRFAVMNDLGDESIDQEEIAHFLCRHPYPESVKAQFRRSIFVRQPEKPKYHPRRVSIRGETVNHEDISIRTRRWCRACLAESDHRRLWFDLVAIRRCPYHGLPLENQLRSGKSIPFYRCGFQDVVEEGVERRERKLDIGSFGHYVLGRLDCEDGFSVPIFDEAILADVIDACENVGILLSRGYSRKYPEHCGLDEAEVGFQTIRQGGGYLATRFLDWALRNLPVESHRKDTNHIFTWLYSRCKIVLKGPLGELILNAMHVVNAALKGSPREITDEYVNSKVVALDKAADEMGIDRRDFSVIVKEMGLIEPGPIQRRRGVAACDLPKVVTFFEGLLDRRALSEVLGMTGYELFVKAGYLRIYHAVGHGRNGPRFRREEVERILETIRTLPESGRTDIARTFHSAATQKWGQRKLALRVLQGKTKIAGTRDRGNGFSRLLVEVNDTNRPKPFRNGGSEVMAIEASRMFGIPSKGLSLLVETGHISYVLNGKGNRVFKRADLDVFLQRYVKQSVAARALKQYGSGFAADLRAKKLEPAVSLTLGRWQVNFYDKSVLATAYHVPEHVFDLKAPELDRFWTFFVGCAQVKARGLRLPTKFPLDGCWGGSAVRHSIVRFTYESERQVLRARIAPVNTSGVGFEFDVHGAPDDDLFDELFDAVASANAREKAKTAGYAVRWRENNREYMRAHEAKKREKARHKRLSGQR